jgi:hypothetical protein
MVRFDNFQKVVKSCNRVLDGFFVFEDLIIDLIFLFLYQNRFQTIGLG